MKTTFEISSVLRPVFMASIAGAAFVLAACSESDDSRAERDLAESEVALTESVQEILPAEETPQAEGADTQRADVRSAESHVHGGATLALVVENNEITAELETPLYNLLGFEHAPDTDAQRAAVGEAEAILSDATLILGLDPKAGCEAIRTAEAVKLFDESEAHHTDDHHHDDEQHHDDEYSHDDEEGHDDEADDEHSSHRDVILTYRYRCASPSALSRVSADVLSAFPLMETLDIVYLGPNTQQSFVLDQDNIFIDLER